MQNPEERLDQLRRSSLMEFEHLKKDEHPDPPLRALPEHSVVGEKEGSAAPAPTGSDGANDGPNVAEKDFAATEGEPSATQSTT